VDLDGFSGRQFAHHHMPELRVFVFLDRQFIEFKNRGGQRLSRLRVQ
jgi:hypothetical protein